MPIFEFECKECNENFEELVLSGSTVQKITCPECGGNQVRKKISSFASRFNGGSSLSFSGVSSSSCSTGST